MKSTTNELWKCWKLACYDHFTHIACAKKLRGLRQNWMHFVYKTDNLSRSIRVSNENSSLTKGFHFFWTYLNFILFVCSKCTIQRHITKFQQFLTSFGIFRAFTYFFWASWPWNWKALQMNSENVQSWHGIIISPAYHVLKSWEGYDKNWMHFVYKMDNLSQSIRVSNENSSVTKGIHFFELIWTP